MNRNRSENIGEKRLILKEKPIIIAFRLIDTEAREKEKMEEISWH